jgi:hypothetical protein
MPMRGTEEGPSVVGRVSIAAKGSLVVTIGSRT